jgi:hypothetical protein
MVVAAKEAGRALKSGRSEGSAKLPQAYTRTSFDTQGLPSIQGVDGDVDERAERADRERQQSSPC